MEGWSFGAGEDRGRTDEPEIVQLSNKLRSRQRTRRTIRKRGTVGLSDCRRVGLWESRIVSQIASRTAETNRRLRTAVSNGGG